MAARISVPKAEQKLKMIITAAYQRYKDIYGYPRIQAWLHKTYGIQINHKRVYRLMKELGIQARIRKKRKFFGRREQVVASENKLNHDFAASRPLEKWATTVSMSRERNMPRQRLYRRLFQPSQDRMFVRKHFYAG